MSAAAQVRQVQRARSWILRVTDADLDASMDSARSFYTSRPGWPPLPPAQDAARTARILADSARTLAMWREDRDLLLFVDPDDLDDEECFAVYRRLDHYGAGAAEPLTLPPAELADRRRRAVELIRSPGFDRYAAGEGVLSHLGVPGAGYRLELSPRERV